MKCWDVSSITDMSSLFYYSQLNEPINCWNVSSVTTMFGMFASATNFNQPIENWNVGSVTNMYGKFYNATKFNQDLCPWYSKLPSTTTFTDIFSGTNCPYEAIPDLQVKASFCQACAPTSTCPAGFTFNTCANCCGYKFTTKDDLRGAEYNYPGNQGTFGEMKCWDVSSITDMSSLFSYSQLNEPIGCWNVGSVTTMFGMFASATNFNQPIENWNVGSVTNMYGKFYNAIKFNQDLCPWYNKLPSTTTYTDIFSGTNCPYEAIPDLQVKASFCQACAPKPVPTAPVPRPSAPKPVPRAPVPPSAPKPLPTALAPKPSAPKPVQETCTAGFTFNACANCCGYKFTTKDDLQGAEYNYPGNQGTFGEMKCWDVSSITDMSSLFYYSQLNEPIGCWNVSSVTTMFGMFESATNFNQPIENWNVGSVTNMYGMFYDATMV
jgi:surface protein